MTAASASATPVSLQDVQTQITQVATFNGNQVTLKAVDATNAKVSIGQNQTTTVGNLASENSAANVFLDFFRRLFGPNP